MVIDATKADAILAPISSKDPSGPSLRYSLEYDQIREAMRAEEAYLPQGIWQRKIKQPDWTAAKKLCQEALSKKSKDLQIAAWYIEALIHSGTIDDVKFGFQTFYDLMVKFWDTIHPTIPEDGDIEFRLSPFIWINEKLSQSLKYIKITEKTQVGASIYTFHNWLDIARYHDLYQVDDRPQDPNVLDQIGSNKTPTLLDLEANISKTSTRFYQNFYASSQHILDICKSIDDFLDKKFSEDAITLFNIKKNLQDIQNLIRDILHKRGELSDEDDAEKDQQPHQETITNHQSIEFDGVQSPKKQNPLQFTPIKGVPIEQLESAEPSILPQEGSQMPPIKNRNQAYEIIEQAVEYLEKIEPHSPVPFMIKKAIALRDKNFMQLMQEIQKDSGPGSLSALWTMPATSNESS